MWQLQEVQKQKTPAVRDEDGMHIRALGGKGGREGGWGRKEGSMGTSMIRRVGVGLGMDEVREKGEMRRKRICVCVCVCGSLRLR